MTDTQFQQLLSNPHFLIRESFELLSPPETIETHISYVILTEQRVYKIKKTLRLPFLDFSTTPLRQQYCQQELRLNQRMASDMYLSVLPVKEYQGHLFIGEGEGTTIDFALEMRRMDNTLEMDRMLQAGRVQEIHITDLAQRIAAFHQTATVVRPNYSIAYFQKLFNPIGEMSSYIEQHLGDGYGTIIHRAVDVSNQFLIDHIDLLCRRSRKGLVRDVHGDLHSKNIFLTKPPTVFDCIEFDAGLRQIDLLNEVAFLCMDLDFWQQKSLGQLFYRTYLSHMQQMGTENIENEPLFVYFKLYRASVRAKVLGLLTQNASPSQSTWKEIERYIQLMNQYLLLLSYDRG